MNTVFKASALSQALLLALVAPASLAAPADPAQPATPATPVTAVAAAPEPKQLDTVVVQAEIAYRNRTPDIAPVLSYDLEYFQRFEPHTVGDLVKRLPGAAFLGSDIMDYDGVQLRGLGAVHTPVQRNGTKVPRKRNCAV